MSEEISNVAKQQEKNNGTDGRGPRAKQAKHWGVEDYSPRGPSGWLGRILLNDDLIVSKLETRHRSYAKAYMAVANLPSMSCNPGFCFFLTVRAWISTSKISRRVTLFPKKSEKPAIIIGFVNRKHKTALLSAGEETERNKRVCQWTSYQEVCSHCRTGTYFRKGEQDPVNVDDKL